MAWTITNCEIQNSGKILTSKRPSLTTDFIHLKEKDIVYMIFNYYMLQYVKDANALLKVKSSR